MEPLRILLVGFGVRGRQWLRVLANRADMALAGVVEPAPVEIADVGVRIWPALEPGLAEGAFDVALICSPPERHADDAAACLGSGLHVMVEKPLAPSYAEASRIAGAADRSGRVALVGQNFRFRPHETLVREVLAEGAVGPVRSVDVRSRRPRPTRTRRGDVLWDYAIHHLDLLRTRFGEEVRRIDRARVDPVRVDLDLSLVGGARVHYRHEDGTRRFRYRERIRGDRGSIELGEGGVTGPGDVRRRANGPSGEERLLDELGAAIRGEPSAVSAADNLRTVALVLAVGRSAAERRPVHPTEVMEDPGAALTPGGTGA